MQIFSTASMYNQRRITSIWTIYKVDKSIFCSETMLQEQGTHLSSISRRVEYLYQSLIVQYGHLFEFSHPNPIFLLLLKCSKGQLILSKHGIIKQGKQKNRIFYLMLPKKEFSVYEILCIIYMKIFMNLLFPSIDVVYLVDFYKVKMKII